jgi:hypothetical protein
MPPAAYIELSVYSCLLCGAAEVDDTRVAANSRSHDILLECDIRQLLWTIGRRQAAT